MISGKIHCIYISKFGNHWNRGRQLMAYITWFIDHYSFIFLPNTLQNEPVGNFLGTFIQKKIEFSLSESLVMFRNVKSMSPSGSFSHRTIMHNVWDEWLNADHYEVLALCEQKGQQCRACHSLLFPGPACGLNDVITC